MLPISFLIVLCACFLLMMTLLKPAAGKERVRLRLADVRPMRYLAKTATEEAGLRTAQDSWHVRIETWLQDTAVGVRLRRLLLHARSRRTPLAFLSICAGASACVGVFAGLASRDVYAAMGAALIAGCIYPALLLMRRAKRLKRFAEQLPATAVMMARALRAGHPIPQMLELAAEQAKNPLREDFTQLAREQGLGVPLREALLSLSSRVPLPDLRFMVSAILLQRETGGDLIQILDRTAGLIEERMRLRRQIETFSAQGRMSAWILTGLPVALLVLLSVAMPGYAGTVFHDAAGQRLLLVGLLLLFMGGYIIHRIVDIEI